VRSSEPSWSVALAVALGLVLTACGSDGSTASVRSSGDPQGPPSVPSAKGKPCVAPVDPMPAGAPQVPVPTGPPPTELVVRDITPGTGAAATASSSLSLDYTAVMCSNGKLLDSSYTAGAPMRTTLAQVIPGWQQGIPGMKVGGTRLLGVPPALAYGPVGDPPTIAPDETLWFVIQLRAAQG
jgi:peptidylprolyl isomerase